MEFENTYIVLEEVKIRKKFLASHVFIGIFHSLEEAKEAVDKIKIKNYKEREWWGCEFLGFHKFFHTPNKKSYTFRIKKIKEGGLFEDYIVI